MSSTILNNEIKTSFIKFCNKILFLLFIFSKNLVSKIIKNEIFIILILQLSIKILYLFVILKEKVIRNKIIKYFDYLRKKKNLFRIAAFFVSSNFQSI